MGCLISTIEIHYYYTDWCPHCKLFNTEWEKLKQSNTFPTAKYISHNDNDTNYSEHTDISGWPTIILLKKSFVSTQKYIFGGYKTANELITIINEKLFYPHNIL